MSRSLLYKSAFILGLSSLLSRILGVVRDHLLAKTFGVGGVGVFNLDVYYAAFRIPDFIYALLILGTVSAAFVPLLSEQMVKNGNSGNLKEKENLFTSNVLNVLLLGVIAMTLVTFIFTPQLLGLLVPGFDGADLEFTISMTRVMLLLPIFFGISSVFQAIQNVFDKFFYFALAPIIYNLAIIIGIYVYSPEYGVPAVAWAAVVGAFLHFFVQLPGIWKVGFKYSFFIDFKDKYLREMVKLVLPRIVGSSMIPLNMIFDTLIASLLAGGSITVLNYAVNFNSLPLGMVGISFAIASFATMSKLAIEIKGPKDKEGHEKFASQLNKVITSVLYFVLPAVVGLFVLRVEIVDIILNNGAFTDKDVVLTANTLGFFLIGLFAQSLIPVMSRAFFALKNTIIPVIITVVSILINIGLNYHFAITLDYGVYGIALATSVASILNFFSLVVMMRLKYLRGISFISLGRIGAICFSSVVMGVVVFYVREGFVDMFVGDLISKILALVASILVGAIIFFVSIYPFKLEETKLLYRRFIR